MPPKQRPKVSISEKRKPLPNPSTGSSSEDDTPSRPRGPFPILGLLALVGAILTIVISLALLLVVQGPANETSQWSRKNLPKPAAWLSIILSTTSFLLHSAFTEGAAVAWWNRAQGEEVTVKELHELWQHSTSTQTSIGHGLLKLKSKSVDPLVRAFSPTSRFRQRRFSYVAFACLIVAVNPVIGVLLQSAVVVHTDGLQKNGDFMLPMAQSMPIVSGVIDDYTSALLSFTPTWSRLTQRISPGTTYADLGDFDSGCKDTCFGEVVGLGFDIRCEESSIPYNVTSDFTDRVNCGSARMLSEGQVVFKTEVIDTWRNATSNPSDSFIMRLDTVWKNDSAEVGALASKSCTFVPATVKYPVMLKANTPVAAEQGTNSTLLYLDPKVKLLEAPFERVDYVTAYVNDGSYSVNQGIPALFGGYFNSSINLFYKNFTAGQLGKCGNRVEAQGILAQQQLALSNISALGWTTSTSAGTGTFEWESADIATQIGAQVQSMMFFISAYMALANATAGKDMLLGESPPLFQNVSGTLNWSEERYHVVWRWYFAALGVTIAIAAAITPTFWGYWHLPRKPTMTPFETARAFHAPLVEEATAATDADKLLKEIGEQQIHGHFSLRAHNLAVLRAYVEREGRQGV